MSWRMAKALLLILVIISCFSLPINAVDLKTFNLGQIVVTATKAEKEVTEVPASVSVMTGEDISDVTAVFADEALKAVPGAYLKRSKFMDTVSNVTLRGFSSKTRTLVLLDGMPLNDGYTGGMSWASIPIDNIERIEVIKGPFSSLYGGNAMSGVINIITKDPTKSMFFLKTGYGTYHTFTQHLGYSNFFFDKVGLYLSWDKKNTDGYRSNLVTKSAFSGTGSTVVTGWTRTKNSTGKTVYLIGDKGENWWDQDQFSGKVIWNISSKSKLSFACNLSTHKLGYKDPQSYLCDTAGNPVNSGSVTIKDEGDKKMTLYTYSFIQGPSVEQHNSYILNYEGFLHQTKITSKLGLIDDMVWYITSQSGATEDGGPGKINITDPKRSVQFEAQADVPLKKKHNLTLGLSLRKNEAKGEEWKLSNWKDEGSKTDLTTSMKGKQLVSAIYSQLELVLHKKLRLYLGGRFDYWRNYDGESYDANNPPKIEYDARTDYCLSPKIGIVYNPFLKRGLWELKTIRVSAGRAFRPPTLYELYKTWSWYSTIYESNPNLSSEITDSWDIGIEQLLFQGYTKIAGSYYESYIKNLIYYKEVATKHKRKENAGKGEIKGIEGEVQQYITSWLTAFGNFTYQKTEITENESDPNSEGKQFTYVPKSIFNAGLHINKGPFKGTLNFRWVDKVYTKSDNSDKQEGVYGTYDKVQLLDMKISYNLNKNFKISLSVNNVLNREYYQYYKAPGRTFNLETEVKF